VLADFSRLCEAPPLPPSRAGAAAPRPAEALDPAVREKLKALGYVDQSD